MIEIVQIFPPTPPLKCPGDLVGRTMTTYNGDVSCLLLSIGRSHVQDDKRPHWEQALIINVAGAGKVIDTLPASRDELLIRAKGTAK